MAFGIDIDFNAQVGRLSDQLDRASQDLGRFGERAEQVANGVSSSFKSMAAGLSVAAIGAYLKSGIDAADELNDVFDRTGVSVENFSNFQLAIELGDTSAESFANTLNKLSINIVKNSEGFASLGITAKDPLEAFIQLAEVFSSIEDPQTRAAFGAKALGKSYAEMAPLLLMGADGLNDLSESGKALTGITLEQAQAAGAFNDKLAEMEIASAGFRTRVALGVLEPLTEMAAAMDKNIEKHGILRGAWLGLIDTFKESVGLKIGLEGEIDVIDRKINKLRESIKDLQGGTGFGSQLIPIKEKEINDLLNQRFEIVKKISEERSKSLPSQTQQQEAPTPDAITGFISGQKPSAEGTKEQTEAERQRQEILREGLRLTEQMRTPIEKLADEQARYKSLLDSGAISLSTYTRAMQAANDATLNLVGGSEELSSAEQFRLKSEADSLKIRLEQQRLDIINKRDTPENEKPFQNLQEQAAAQQFAPGNEKPFQSLQDQAAAQPVTPVKIQTQINAEDLAKSLSDAVAFAQQQVTPITIPIVYADGEQGLDTAALAGGRR